MLGNCWFYVLFTLRVYSVRVHWHVKKTVMATPFADPRTGMLYLRRAVPEALRPAFEGRAVYKVTLKTKDPAEARTAYAQANAEFERRLADARRRIAEGTLVTTPGALVRRWCEGGPVDGGLTGPHRLMATLMELDATVGSRHTSAAGADVYPPPILGPAANVDWSAVLRDPERFEAVVADGYGGDIEQVGTNWIRARWHAPDQTWLPALTRVVERLRGFDASASSFSGEDLSRALLAALDEKRQGDENHNRARLARQRPRPTNTRLRPTMRLRQLFAEWQIGNEPRPQTAGEYEAAIEDFIDFAGDVPIATIDADLLYDYRDEAANLPASMPRADRALPFRARVEKHATSLPKCAAPTLKKRIGALQALLTYAFQQRWTATNAGVGIRIVGYTKKRRTRRSFEDHELGLLCACPLFTDPASWTSTSRISDATIFWLFLFAITTGARLEEVGQVALADVRRDGDIVYLDIDEYAIDEAAAEKSVKTDDSKRLVPVHAKLIALGFLDYCESLRTLGHVELFPDLRENTVGKRTKEASQRVNRIIDRHVSFDRRLVFHSLRHAFKAKGNDANITSRTLDQICGHAPVTDGERYGSELRIRTIYRELHRIDFSCIDWEAIQSGIGKIEWKRTVAKPR